MGGKRISAPLGLDYREHLVRWIAEDARGSADLCAYFYLRAAQLVGRAGSVSLLATNTIAQGDTREVGLDRLTADGWSINRAVKSRPWPGGANLEISEIWLRRGEWGGRPWLDGVAVPAITPSLDPQGRVSGPAHRLAENAGKSFMGSNIVGVGFTMSPEQAHFFMKRDPRNADVLSPYLNGEDLTRSADQSPSRWIINFYDWSLAQAETFPDCMAVVRAQVKPERDRSNHREYRERWWQYGRRGVELYRRIAGFRRVLVIALTSKTVAPLFVPGGWVYSHMLGVFAYDDDAHLGLLTSTFHYWWAIASASTLETRIRYTPSDCFETFPQPMLTPEVGAAGAAVDVHRRQLMLARQEGLTKTYDRVHDPKDHSDDIAHLRQLHVQLDHAVAHAYAWADLPLDHGFHDTRQGVRYTIGPAARVEVLDRLLELNHQRYAAELERGLHGPKRSRSAQLTMEGI
jgi:hypothetical protein